MSVVLQRGDRVHLAIPVSPMKTAVEAEREVKARIAELIPQYAALGVEVALWSGNSSLDRITVVAVFRNATDASQAGQEAGT